MFQLHESAVNRRSFPHSFLLLALGVLLVQLVLAQMIDDARSVRVAEDVDRRPYAIAETRPNRSRVQEGGRLTTHYGWEINPLTSKTVKHTSLFSQLSDDPSSTD